MIATDPRPEWTLNNVELFSFWMRTGQAEQPTEAEIAELDASQETEVAS